MRAVLSAISSLGLLVAMADTSAAQYYRGYRDYPPPSYYAPYRPRAIQCPQGLVPDNDRYGRQFCREWYPTRGSECPPGYTLQSGRCKPHRGY